MCVVFATTLCSLTSVGSDILNSQPSPVQDIKLLQVESRSSSKRNCHNCIGPEPYSQTNTIFMYLKKILKKGNHIDALMQMQLKILAHLDKLKSLPPDPPCLISGGMSFCVWPHEGSTALKIEDCRLRGRRVTAGAVGEQSMEMYTQNKRTTWTPVHQNHSSSDRWKLEQKQNSFISNTTIRDVYNFFLSQTSKNILL